MTLDLMAGLGIATGPKLDWRPWRWPLALAAAVLVVNAAALNIDWWRLKSETDSLRANMVQIYKSAYPKESVIIDPIAQMQQKIAIAKHNSGLPAPDDFTAIVAAFGEAWAGTVATAGKTTAIAALDYHEHSLYVRLKPGGEVADPADESRAGKIPAGARTRARTIGCGRLADQERKMNLKALLGRSRLSFSEFWAARDARERAMLAAAALVVTFGLAYALLIDPALSRPRTIEQGSARAAPASCANAGIGQGSRCSSRENPLRQ